MSDKITINWREYESPINSPQLKNLQKQLQEFTSTPEYKNYTANKMAEDITDTPTAKARWVLIYIHFQIYSKAYKTNESL